LDNGSVSFLFAGDIEKKTEDKITKVVKVQLKVDILKVFYHGFQNRSIVIFIRAVSTEVAIVSWEKKN
jgi:beta-lactamase superfamily II metal-dependent hydrolase